MSAIPRILLISHLPELHHDKVLAVRGFEVVTATSLTEGFTLWRPFHFDLVLIVVDGDTEAATKFCAELKALDPKQNVAFVTGWHTYVPPSACPDEVIQREHGPSTFLRKVAELVEIQ